MFDIPLSTRGFMLDTSAINRIHDGRTSGWSIRGPLFVTEIQLQEIAQTPIAEHRESLLRTFVSLAPTIIRPTGLNLDPEFFGFDSYYDIGHFLSDEDTPRPFGRVMPLIAGAIGTTIERHFSDAVIAEAAISGQLTLVTADKKQAKAARRFGARVEQIP